MDPISNFHCYLVDFVDDLWVVSQSLKFDQLGQTFIAKSAFYGPNCDNELELTPIAG